MAYLFFSPSLFMSLCSIHPTWRWVCDFFFFYFIFYFILFHLPFFLSHPPGASCILFFLPPRPALPPPPRGWCAVPQQPLGMPLDNRSALKVPHPNGCKMVVRTWKKWELSRTRAFGLPDKSLRDLNLSSRCVQVPLNRPRLHPRGWKIQKLLLPRDKRDTLLMYGFQ